MNRRFTTNKLTLGQLDKIEPMTAVRFKASNNNLLMSSNLLKSGNNSYDCSQGSPSIRS